MNIAGPRPDVAPVHHGEYEPLRVYLIGDLVTWDGKTYRAQADLRSGFLEPPTVISDTGDEFWVEA